MGATLGKSIISSVGVFAIAFAGIAAVEQPAHADPPTAPRVTPDPHMTERVQASRSVGKAGWHSVADKALQKSLNKLKPAKKKAKIAPLASRGLRISNVRISGRHVHAVVHWDAKTLRKNNGNQLFRVRLAGSQRPGIGAARSVVVEKKLRGLSREAISFGLSPAKAKEFRKMAKVYLAVSQRFDSFGDDDKLFEEFHVGSVQLAPSARGGSWRVLSRHYSSRFDSKLHSNSNVIDFSGADLRDTYQPANSKSSRSATTLETRGYSPGFAGCRRRTSTTVTLNNSDLAGVNFANTSFSPTTKFIDSTLSGANMSDTCWLTQKTTSKTTGKQTLQKVIADGSNFGPSSTYGITDLTNADLVGAHFKNANFAFQNFGWFRSNMVNMDGLNVTGACLNNATLAQASLQNVNFTVAGNDVCTNHVNMNMVGANLTGSNWTGMSLGGNSGNLNGANFTNATMTNVSFDGIDISSWQAPSGDWIPASFSGVDMSASSGVSFTGTNFQGDVFVGTNLSGQILGTIMYTSDPGHAVFTNFNYAWFSNANLGNTEMSWANNSDNGNVVAPGSFNLVTFTDGTQLPTNLADIQFDGGNTDWGTNCAGTPGHGQNYAQFTNLTIPNTDFSNSTLVCTNFDGTTLDGSNLSGAPIQASTFNNASAQNINWNQGVAGNTSLVYAVLFTNANLSGGNFSGLDMQYLNLTNANLSNASLNNALLQNATLTGANFLGAALGGANFDGATPTGLNNTASCAVTIWYDNTTKSGSCTP